MQRTNNMKKTAEAVSLGHPDKTADYISSYILDRMIEQDANVHYAVEVIIKDNIVVLGGEISGDINLTNVQDYVVAAIGEIGYDEFYSLRWSDKACLWVTLAKASTILAENNTWRKNSATLCISTLCKISTSELTLKPRLLSMNWAALKPLLSPFRC